MTIEVTRFHADRRGYKKCDSALLTLDTETRFHDIIQHIDNAVTQLRYGQGQPRGLSFASYRTRGCVNKYENLTRCGALVLDYARDQFDELREAAAGLGYACLFIVTENLRQTVNTISLVIPFVSPVDPRHYTRIASCIAAELDVYGLQPGALAATHIVNIHATSTTAMERGELLDGEAYVARTARHFQGLDARKYEQPSRPAHAARAQIERPTITSENGLFEWPS